jgi:replicative DNA helicase
MTKEQMDLNKTLATYDGPDRVERASLIYEEELKKPSIPCYSTGLTTLDSYIKGGVYPGQLVIISGTTGHGKTTLGQTITCNMLPKFILPVWFSFEVTTRDFLEQFDHSYRPYFYMPLENKQSNMQWVEHRIIESYLKYNTKVVFIDHLHRIVDMGSKDNLSTQVGKAVIELKKMALRHGMVIFLICHTTKTNSQDGELSLGDVRDSSFIEQEADTVLYVWRDKEDQTRTVCKLAKNRKGGVIDKRIALRWKEGVYYEESFERENEGIYQGPDKRNGSGMGKRKAYGSFVRENGLYGE